MHTHSATCSRDLLSVSIDFAVAMIAAARDVVIDIEERPIVKAEVNNNVLTKGVFTVFSHVLLFVDTFSLFSHFAAPSRKGEIFSFHR